MAPHPVSSFDKRSTLHIMSTCISVNFSILCLYSFQVSILQHMTHPYIIGLIGVCRQPTPMLILEFAEFSSLRSFQPYTTLGRSLRHRIAIQVPHHSLIYHSFLLSYHQINSFLLTGGWWSCFSAQKQDHLSRLKTREHSDSICQPCCTSKLHVTEVNNIGNSTNLRNSPKK